MAGKQVGDGLPASLAGMSKNQLYEIMSQMKALIEQNQQQARQILIQNPLLTKALFQAQIMLGMVKPPQVIPSVQPPALQQPQQSAQLLQQPNIQSAQTLPVQEQPSVSQTQTSIRKPHQNQPAMPVSSASVPAVNLQSQPMHSHQLQVPQQPKGHLNPPVTTMSLPQSSQISNMPPIPHHSASQPPALHQPQMPTASNQLQQPLQSTGPPHMPLQPPLPPQPRPSFHHQYAPHMGPNVGFQHPGAQQHPSQPVFHSGNKPPASMGPSFQQGQPPPQSLYQLGGSHLGTEFNNQVGNSMQVDRGSWMSGPPDNPLMTQLQGPPPVVPGQMGPGNQPPRPASLSPEMEKALLQQVMSLTPEQINLLPPEQRNQVLQLQQILRQ
ncbi:cleavage stimulating factor 64-like [Melia azedarach]|uniref:Cleavage stimulating factor 64-like n=1 Tax=Melia azedarach TaxID=155640 RepID=A0ACC1XRQ3_MELAZ|nr:cleavage stimulating factor 64-like [Melia azedarach]